jgi:phosphoglycerate dehydrogenase-like enzyme
VAKLPVVVIEDDPFTRVAQLVLDPGADAARRAAFADFFKHDEPDFEGWCARLRARVPGFAPAEVRMVTSQEELRANIADCRVLIVESLNVGRDELAVAPQLKAVQKYGALVRNIDAAACAEKGVKLLTLRRRANISCAEHAFGMMLTLSRRLDLLNGRVSAERLAKAGFPVRPFDRRHAPGGNYGRVPGLRALNEATMGIIGLGEIGREIALRAQAFGMRVLYHQRTRADEADERQYSAQYVPLDALLGESDWIVPQVPTAAATRNLIGRDELSRIKPGACIVSVSNALVINRDAMIEALRSGRLAGAALDTHYEEPCREDDELLHMDNVVLTPRMGGSPRFNALKDFEQMITGLAREVAT